MNILVHVANETAKQNSLESAYNDSFDPETEVDPKTLISFDGENYDFIVGAKYPSIYKVNGIQSVISYNCSQAIVDLINSLPSNISILAFDDNNPDNDYIWEGGGNSSKAKFESVVGNTFLTGEGTPGQEGYIAPRKKLSMLI